MTNKTEKPDKSKLQNQSRFAVFQRESVDTEKRTVEVAFSSEEPVARWYGDEVLSHDAGAVDLSRLNDGGAVLFNHDWDKHIGVIERAWIDADKKGRALIRFGHSPRADEKWQDVQDGLLRHISVGYNISDLKQSVESEKLTFTAMRWQPYEISFVTVPADTTVGVGRSVEPVPSEPAATPENPVDNPESDKGNRSMSKEQNTSAAVVAADPNNTAERGMQDERARVSGLLAIGRAYESHGGVALAEKVISEGGNEAQLRAAIMENMKTTPTVTSDDIGMNENEKREFSLLRALGAASKNDWSNAGLEREVSQELAKRFGRDAAGFFVPTDLLSARAYSKGTAANGGHTVANELRPDLFVEMLRNRLSVAQLGATVLDGLVGDITIPKQLTGNSVTWVDENGAASESNATFGQFSLKPKTVTANTELSRKFILQSSLSAEQFARAELIKSMMLGIDLAAIAGTGSSNQPTGILNTNGIGTVAIDTNGGELEWKHIVALETAIAAANADLGDLAYLTNTKVRGQLKTKLKADGVSGYIWQDGETPLNGYRCAVSNQVPSNLTKGSASGKCSPLIFGNWADLIIAHWGVLDVIVDPYTQSNKGAVRITTLQDVDIAVRHAESFAAIKDIVTG
ncbi:phage major capsid protein [Neisseria dentiae]|uniref:phage major capsid protein n=1 Tax=Neisseria dentiae TaxID=194197 RepID=UPI00211C7248|nr:phage major capsid protein [Neisseria dentiae]MCQ9325525.1 phage major capsid protein [Neisseria dentiae]